MILCDSCKAYDGCDYRGKVTVCHRHDPITRAACHEARVVLLDSRRWGEAGLRAAVDEAIVILTRAVETDHD
jgi:hypothetical protein